MFRALQINVIPLPWEGNMDGKQEGTIFKAAQKKTFSVSFFFFVF